MSCDNCTWVGNERTKESMHPDKVGKFVIKYSGALLTCLPKQMQDEDKMVVVIIWFFLFSSFE